MKLLKLLIAMILTTGILVACDSGDVEQDATAEIQLEVIISLENGEEILEEESLEVAEGKSLMEVMEENFNVVNDGGLVTAINDIQAEGDEPYSWFYTINGEHAMSGAEDYIVEDGDLIEFDFHSWE